MRSALTRFLVARWRACRPALAVLGRYVKNVLVALDQLVNALLGGDPDETISSRAAKSNSWWACRLCRLLDLIDPGHCANAREADEGRDAVVP